MGVDNNHYNYQIAVIFAILIGGCLLLGGTIAAIYYVCVVNMRDDKKRLTSRRNSPSPWQQQQPYRPAEPSPQPYPVPVAQYAPPAGQFVGTQYTQYAPQYETSYQVRSTVPSPLAAQPQPLLTPQNYEPFRPSPAGYDDVRVASVAQPMNASYHQSSV